MIGHADGEPLPVGWTRLSSGPVPSKASDSARSGKGRNEARPDGEGERVDPPGGLGDTLAAPQNRAASTTKSNGPKLPPRTGSSL